MPAYNNRLVVSKAQQLDLQLAWALAAPTRSVDSQAASGHLLQVPQPAQALARPLRLAALQVHPLVLVLHCQSFKQVHLQHSLVVRQQGVNSRPSDVAPDEVCLSDYTISHFCGARQIPGCKAALV
jgi:hypothetical protein